MANTGEEIDKLIKQVEQLRDEIRVKAALAKLEAREEWQTLEKQWNQVKTSAPQVRAEIGSTMHKTIQELRDGYARLRKLL